jgi:hypothetical protein
MTKQNLNTEPSNSTKPVLCNVLNTEQWLKKQGFQNSPFFNFQVTESLLHMYHNYVKEQEVKFDYIKCPLHRYTFKIKNIREWTENNCEGRTLNLFAGRTKLNIDEVRNDLDTEALADYRMDAVEFLRTWKGEKFDTVLLDPPYAFRKSMEMYKGIKCSPFKQMKDEIKNVLKDGGKVITFGYHSNTMGANRGFKVEKIGLFSHGGAIHDTIASVERHIA